MAEQTGARAGEARMDAGSLYREEIYTDRAAGTLRVLVPVKADGSADAARPTLFIGEAQILTNMGPLPICSPRRDQIGEWKIWRRCWAESGRVEKLERRILVRRDTNFTNLRDFI